jgi:hypothetical protein
MRVVVISGYFNPEETEKKGQSLKPNSAKRQE